MGEGTPQGYVFAMIDGDSCHRLRSTGLAVNPPVLFETYLFAPGSLSAYLLRAAGALCQLWAGAGVLALAVVWCCGVVWCGVVLCGVVQWWARKCLTLAQFGQK